MTFELWVLLATSMLAASLWIPFIIGVNMHMPASEDPFVRPPDLRLFPNWVQRANRAHLNLMEQFVPFAVLVLLAHQVGVSTGATQGATLAFLVLRIAHALGHTSGVARMPVRPIIFTLAWIAVLVIALEIVRAGLV